MKLTFHVAEWNKLKFALRWKPVYQETHFV